MITLRHIVFLVTFAVASVKHTDSVYDASESEVYTKYDDELLTTRVSKNEDDYLSPEVTTNDEVTLGVITTLTDELTTTNPGTTTSELLTESTVEDLTTTVNDGTTVKRFIYRTPHIKTTNETNETTKPKVQVGKVYAILESLIKTDKEEGDFEDTTDEIATALYYEVSTNIVDYFDRNLGNSMLSDFNKTTTENIQTFNMNVLSLCPHFIERSNFEMDKMTNVWQPVYSDLREQLPCFKILIRRTLEEEREQYEQWYGNFNESMNWKDCNFEVKSGAVKYRKHFLQGGVGDKGVMRNILLVQNRRGDYDLVEENPDQWIIVKNLLILHDCSTGETIVFARVPSHPCKAVISEALQELGLKVTGEMLLCFTG